MNNEEKILSVLEQVLTEQQNTNQRLGNLENRFDKLENRFDSLENRFDKLETKVDDIDATVKRMENDHGSQLGALQDGVLQNSQRLDRIEKEVSRQQEFIIRKIK